MSVRTFTESAMGLLLRSDIHYEANEIERAANIYLHGKLQDKKAAVERIAHRIHLTFQEPGLNRTIVQPTAAADEHAALKALVALERLINRVSPAFSPLERESPRHVELWKQKFDAPGFDPVYQRAQDRYLADRPDYKQADTIYFHEREYGRVILRAAAKYGLGSRVMDWPSVIAKIIASTESTHIELQHDKEFLRHIVHRKPNIPGAQDLYTWTASELAGRVCKLSDPNPQKTPPQAWRLYSLLAEGVELQKVMEMEGREADPISNRDDLSLMAYQNAKERCARLKSGFAL